jgi:hypothetical protein
VRPALQLRAVAASPVPRGACDVPCAPREKVANRNARVWHGRDRKWPLREGQIPNFRLVRVALCVRATTLASRNGPVIDLPPEIPNVTIGNSFIAA